MGCCKRIFWRMRTCAEHVKWRKVNREVDLRLHVLKTCQVGCWTFQIVINILHTFWALSLLLQCKFPGRGGAGAALPCTAGSWLMWDLTSPFLIFQPARFSMTLISSLAISSLTISVLHLNWSVPRFSGVLMSFLCGGVLEALLNTRDILPTAFYLYTHSVTLDKKKLSCLSLSFWQKIYLTVIFSALAAHRGKSKYIIHLLFQNRLNLPSLSGVLHHCADTLKVVINCLRSNFWLWLHSAERWQGMFFSLSGWSNVRTIHLPLETKCFGSSVSAESVFFIKSARALPCLLPYFTAF